jgi:predicted dehydrogenase
MIHLLLIGKGRWGQRYIATLENYTNVKLTVATRENWSSLIEKKPDGVIVCTPPECHIEMASKALDRNIPVLIEKPLSLSLKEAEILKKYNTPVLINHIHLFSKNYQRIKTISPSEKITKIFSEGFGNGPDRDYSSLWDYGSHDVSMILDLMGTLPDKIKLTQEKITSTRQLYTLEMQFGQCTTKSIVGNGGHESRRTLSVESDGLTASYNDREKPADHPWPLNTALDIFLGAILGKTDPRIGLDLALKVLHVLEIATSQLNTK